MEKDADQLREDLARFTALRKLATDEGVCRALDEMIDELRALLREIET